VKGLAIAVWDHALGHIMAVGRAESKVKEVDLAATTGLTRFDICMAPANSGISTKLAEPVRWPVKALFLSQLPSDLKNVIDDTPNFRIFPICLLSQYKKFG
jgi:hypothetical protein